VVPVNLATVFPPFGLRIEAGPLVLRPITDDVMTGLVDLALGGIHDPEMMPFYVPWTDAPPDRLPLMFTQYHWGLRSSFSTEQWSLELAVEYEGSIVGVQAFATHAYTVTRTGETGSWLGLPHHGRGIGTMMRQAICAFCFDHLDAEEITSAAFADNPASNAVSRKVGYQPNGVQRKTRREGEWKGSHQWILTRETFHRGPELTVFGVPEFRRFIGLD
jgi:RimJ/RimL family protein N-acetyltransferase